MSFSWSGIREDLARKSTTLYFQQRYRAMRDRDPALQPFADPVALLGALHYDRLDHARKNAILTALIGAAQGNDAESDAALILILLALWPGLDVVRRRCLGRRLGTADEIASDLLTRATEAVRSLDLSRLREVAATILMNIQRDMLRAVRRETTRQQVRVDVEPDWIPAPPSWAAQAQMRTELQRDLATLIGRDTDLVLGVALDGFSQLEMSRCLAIGEAATRKRYQRATTAIRHAW